jgi:predicted nucleic acid-binding protein
VIAVVDASAAVRLLLAPSQNPVLRGLLLDADLVLAPELYAAETASAVWKYVRAGVLTRAEATRLFDACLELPDEYTGLAESAVASFHLACRHGSTVYDCLYLALAQERGAALITADRRLAHLARALGVPVPAVA